jgi:hypothetical protein
MTAADRTPSPRNFTPAITRLVTGLNLLVALTYGRYQYFFYDIADAPYITYFRDFLHGNSVAPEQYRVAFPWLLLHMNALLHLHIYQSATLLTTVPFFFALQLLYAILNRSSALTALAQADRNIVLCLHLALLQLPCYWITVFPRPETMPTVFTVAAAAYLLSVPRPQSSSIRALLFLLLCIAQAFLRADVACVLGLVAFGLSLRSFPGLAMSRRLLATTGLISCLGALGIQLYLMRIVYPQAHYKTHDEPFQLISNFTHAHHIVSMVLALGLFLYVASFYRRFARTLLFADHFLLIAALVYLPLWLVLGIASEVRIFVPFLVAVSPVAAMLLYLRVFAQPARSEPAVS